MSTMQHRFLLSALLAILCLAIPGRHAAAAEPPKGAVAVTLTTTDDYAVSGWYFRPRTTEAPALILLHMFGSDKSAFTKLAGKLVVEGYAVIAIDFRGHGETLDPQGRNDGYKALKESDFQAMLNDVQAAHEFLGRQLEVDAERVGIIGASIGANLAIMYASQDLRVRTVVALSAGQDYKGLVPAEYLDALGRRPLYLICAKQDEYSWQSSLALEKLALKADPVSLRVFAGRSHGTDLLESYEGLDDTIVSGWLLNYLAPRR